MVEYYRGGLVTVTEILGLLGGDGKTAIQLMERAGRTCYQSQAKITDDSAAKFVQMLRDRGHEAMLEHSSLSVAIRCCSRGLTHELVRHRLASFAQESTRYVDEGNFEIVLPPSIPDASKVSLRLGIEDVDGDVHEPMITLDEWFKLNEQVYRKLRKGWYTRDTGLSPCCGTKLPAQDARQVLPIGITAEITVTTNLREWRTIFGLRTAKAAHWEIRGVMCDLLAWCKSTIPVVFDDFKPVGQDKDGVPYYTREDKNVRKLVGIEQRVREMKSQGLLSEAAALGILEGGYKEREAPVGKAVQLKMWDDEAEAEAVRDFPEDAEEQLRSALSETFKEELVERFPRRVRKSALKRPRPPATGVTERRDSVAKLTEGAVKKGGVNDAPRTPKPRGISPPIQVAKGEGRPPVTDAEERHDIAADLAKELRRPGVLEAMMQTMMTHNQFRKED